MTVKDIARYANISTATVSNVLTGKKFVSEELTMRVYDAIDQLGYRINTYARGLKTNRSYTIGIQIPDIVNPYFGSAIKIIQAEAVAKGYRIVLYNSDNVLGTERQNIESMLDAHVDGIICVAPRLKIKSILESIEVPIVIVDCLPAKAEGNVAFVYSDNYSGAASVAEYLIEKGYQHFSYLAGPIQLVSNANERLRGFIETLEKHGYSKKDCPIYFGEFTFECGQDLMNKYLDDRKPVGNSATFVGSDIMAWGAMEALKTRNLKIPQDIAIVGYDNIYFSNYLYPTLTTVENPIQIMAMEAIKLLLDELDGSEHLAGRIVMIEGKLVVRNSA